MSDPVGDALSLGGVDLELDRHVFLQPHVGIVDYGTPVSGPVVQTDVVVEAVTSSLGSGVKDRGLTRRTTPEV